MYEAVEKEIENIHKSILASWDALDLTKLAEPFNKQAFIKNHIINELNVYTDINHPTNFFCTLAEYIEGKKKNALYHFAPFDEGNSLCAVAYDSLPDLYQEVIKSIAEEFTNDNGYLKQDLRDRVVEIAKTGPLDVYVLKNKNNKELIKLYNPEEKFLAIDCLKAMIPELEEYDT